MATSGWIGAAGVEVETALVDGVVTTLEVGGCGGAPVGDAGGGGAPETGVVGPAGDVGGGVTEAVSDIVGGGRAMESDVSVSTTGALSEAVDEVEGRWSSR